MINLTSKHRVRVSTMPIVLVLALIIAIFAVGTHAQVLVSSGGQATETHGWAVYKNANAEIILVHLPPRDGGGNAQHSIEPAEPGEAHAVRTLSKFPVAIAAIDRKVYLVFPPTYTGKGKIRRVFSGRSVLSPMGAIWGFTPTGRLDSEPMITTPGEIVSFVATSDALWALLNDEGDYTLLRMTSTGWGPTALPVASQSDRTEYSPRWTMLVIDDKLIAIDLSDPSAMRLLGYEESNASSSSWSALDWTPIPEPTGTYQLLGSSRSIIIVDRDHDQTRLRTWSRDGMFTIAQRLDLPEAIKLAALDSVHRLVGVSVGSDEEAGPDETDETHQTDETDETDESVKTLTQIYEIDLSDGSILYAGDPVVVPPVSEQEMRLLIGMMVMIMLGVLVVVIMPDRSGSMGIPEGFALADPGRRLMATMVDVFLVSLLMGIIFDVHVIEILTLSVITRPEGAWLVIPSVIISGIVIMTLMEWRLGASPGKFFVGVRVVRAQPGLMHRVPFWAALVRNVIKWTLPPVVALAMLDPEMLHRGDRATRTLVAYPIIESPKDASSSDEDPDSGSNSGPES